MALPVAGLSGTMLLVANVRVTKTLGGKMSGLQKVCSGKKSVVAKSLEWQKVWIGKTSGWQNFWVAQCLGGIFSGWQNVWVAKGLYGKIYDVETLCVTMLGVQMLVNPN